MPAAALSWLYAQAGLAILSAARCLFDRLLLPGVTIRQEVPNTGVGYLEALFGISFLIAWTL